MAVSALSVPFSGQKKCEVVIKFSKRLLWLIDKFIVFEKLLKNIPVFTLIMSKMFF